MSSQGFAFFMDLSNLDEEQKKAFEEIGITVDVMASAQFATNLEAGKTYYLVGKQDGTVDYTTDISVAEHTHTFKKDNEEIVVVKKDGTSDGYGGFYDTCEFTGCFYYEYTTFREQIMSTAVKSAVYTGKPVTPEVVITTASDGKLSDEFYTVTYKNNKKIGKGTAVIEFKNGYSGTVTKSFKINPKATSVKKLTPARKQIKVSFAKTSNVTGYQVQASTTKDFSDNVKSVYVKDAKKTTATVSKLSAKKKYFVRVRTYKTVDGKKYFSTWTKVKAVKTA